MTCSCDKPGPLDAGEGKMPAHRNLVVARPGNQFANSLLPGRVIGNSGDRGGLVRPLGPEMHGRGTDAYMKDAWAILSSDDAAWGEVPALRPLESQGTGVLSCRLGSTAVVTIPAGVCESVTLTTHTDLGDSPPAYGAAACDFVMSQLQTTINRMARASVKCYGDCRKEDGDCYKSKNRLDLRGAAQCSIYVTKDGVVINLV